MSLCRVVPNKQRQKCWRPNYFFLIYISGGNTNHVYINICRDFNIFDLLQNNWEQLLVKLKKTHLDRWTWTYFRYTAVFVIVFSFNGFTPVQLFTCAWTSNLFNFFEGWRGFNLLRFRSHLLGWLEGVSVPDKQSFPICKIF